MCLDMTKDQENIFNLINSFGCIFEIKITQDC